MAVVTVSKDRVSLLADFHPELATQCRRFKGRWQGKAVGWTFLADQEHNVRGICRTLYGVDGTPEAWADQCNVHVQVEERDIRAPVWRQFNADIFLGGRHIAGVFGPRQALRTGKGVKFLEGAPCCAREHGAYRLAVPDSAVIEIRKYPRAALAFLSEALRGHGALSVA